VKLLEEALSLRASQTSTERAKRAVEEVLEQVRSHCLESGVQSLRWALLVLFNARSGLTAQFALEIIEASSNDAWLLADSERKDLEEMLNRMSRVPKWSRRADVLLRSHGRHENLAAVTILQNSAASLRSHSASTPSLAGAFITASASSGRKTVPGRSRDGLDAETATQRQPEVEAETSALRGLTQDQASLSQTMPDWHAKLLSSPKKRGPTLKQRETWPPDPVAKLPLSFYSTKISLHGWQPSFAGAQFAVPNEVNRPVGKLYFEDFVRPPSSPVGRPSFYGATQQIGHKVV